MAQIFQRVFRGGTDIPRHVVLSIALILLVPCQPARAQILQKGEVVATSFSGFVNPADSRSGVSPLGHVIAVIDIRQKQIDGIKPATNWSNSQTYPTLPTDPSNIKQVNGTCYLPTLPDGNNPPHVDRNGQVSGGASNSILCYPQNPPSGQTGIIPPSGLIPVPSSYQWDAQTMGQVFGIALDKEGDIFTTASSVYGDFNQDKTMNLLGGLVYRIDHITGLVTPFITANPSATYPLVSANCFTSSALPVCNQIPNTNGVGLGNIAFDPVHQQLLVTNFEDGKIYALKGVSGPTGTIVAVYDPFAALGKSDEGTPGFADPLLNPNNPSVNQARRVWAIGVQVRGASVRVYFSTWAQDQYRNSRIGVANKIWSVALDSTGAFTGSLRDESGAPDTGIGGRGITLKYYSTSNNGPNTPYYPSPPIGTTPWSNPISDIQFSSAGNMLVAERTMWSIANGDYGSLGPNFLQAAHNSRVLEFTYNSAGDNWTTPPYPQNQYYLSLFNNTSSAGGADYGYDDYPDNCEQRIWMSGDYLVNLSTSGQADLVYGLESAKQGLYANPNHTTTDYFVDLNNNFPGFADKTTVGDVVVYRDPCSNAFLEVCKSSSITNPVTGSFNFTVTSTSVPTFPTSSLTVPVGACSGPVPIAVTTPSGNVTITETPITGVGVSSITATGTRLISYTTDLASRAATLTVAPGDIPAETVATFTNFQISTGIIEICKDASPGTTVSGSFSFNVTGAANNPYSVPVGACSGPIPVPAGPVSVTEVAQLGFQLVDVSTLPTGRLVSSNLPAGIAVINVAAGGVVSETVVRFVNSPGTGQLKICKVAGSGIPVGQTFRISAVETGVNYTVPAGPASQGGFCVVDGPFPVGTVLTLRETTPAGDQVPDIAVDPTDRRFSASLQPITPGAVMVRIGSGFTEATFTNSVSIPGPTGQLKICKIAGDQSVPLGMPFTFTATPKTGPVGPQIYTVQAGPASQNGYCVLGGTYSVGTSVTVAEATPGYSVTCLKLNGNPIDANGAPAANCTAIPKGMVSVPISAGFTEVSFTNTKGTGPTLGKTFSPAVVPVNSPAGLTFTIANPSGTSLTGVGFVDTLPADVVVATPSGVTGSCGGGTITAAAGSNNISLTGAALPVNASCNFSVNVLAILPGVKINITNPITSNEGGSGNVASATLTVTSPLTISTTTLPSGQVTVAYSAPVQATGGTPPYSWSATGLPAGLSIDPSTGVIAGTPATVVQAAPVVVKVTDSASPPSSASANFALTIGTNPFVITTSSLSNGAVGVPYSQTLTATGGTLPYSWQITAGTLPPGLTLFAQAGVLSGTPTAPVTATPLTFKLTDSGSPAQTVTATLTLTITGIVITTTSLTGGIVGTPYSQNLSAIGGTGAYTWQLTSGTLPAGLTLNPATGVINGTPTSAVTALPLTFKVTDSSVPQQSATATLALTIAAQAPGPLKITTTSLNTGLVNTLYSQTLAATGGTAPYTWKLVTGRLPGGFTLNPLTGEISGNPAAEVPGSFLIFQVTDASSPPQTATQSLTLTIALTLPGLRITTSALPNGVINTAYSQTLAATGGNGAYTWQLTSGSLPPGLTLNVFTGVISGTPISLSNATPLTFKVTDSGSPVQSATASLTLSITPPGLGPLTITTTSLNVGTVGAPYSQTLAATGGMPPYTWKFTAGRLPFGLTLNPATGELSGTPVSEVAGSFVTFQVADSSSPTQVATGSFVVVIRPAN